MKIAEARNQNREQINEERMKHRILAETLRTSYDKTIDILKGQIDTTREEKRTEIQKTKDSEIANVDEIIKLGQQIVDEMNLKHNTMIQMVLDAELNEVASLLRRFGVRDIDLSSTENYKPDARAMADMAGAYDKINNKDMIAEKMGGVESAVDEMLDSKEIRMREIEERWGSANTTDMEKLIDDQIRAKLAELVGVDFDKDSDSGSDSGSDSDDERRGAAGKKKGPPLKKGQTVPIKKTKKVEVVEEEEGWIWDSEL